MTFAKRRELRQDETAQDSISTNIMILFLFLRPFELSQPHAIILGENKVYIVGVSI